MSEIPMSLIEKAARALHAERCCPLDSASDCVDDFLVYAPERGAATIVLAAVYGDIVEAARRDALTAAVDALKKREFDMAFIQGDSPREYDTSEAHYTGYRKGIGYAAEVVTLLRDQKAPSEPLSATETDRQPENAPAPVRDTVCKRSNEHDGRCERLAIEPTERALIGDLPEWWQPEADQ